MKYYFTLISNDYRADKNKLETAAKEATREASHRLVSEKELPDFKKEFIQKIKDLNTKFPRCKPLDVYLDKFRYFKNSESIWITDVCRLDFYEAKNEL